MILNESFYNFEREAIMMNIANISCTQTKKILSEQYKNAIVTKRTFDKVGFYTYFEIPNHIERLKSDIKPFGNVEFNINDTEASVGCVIFVKNGAISVLECYTNTGSLPEEIKTFSIK